MPKLSPRDAAYVDEAPVRFSNETTVAGTPSEVFAVVSDNAGWPDWYPAAKVCRTTSDSTGAGSTRWIHIDVFKLNERVVVWDEPREWAFTILDANVPGFVSAVERFRFEPVGEDRTHVTYAIGAETKGWLRPALPLLRWKLNGLFRDGLQGLETKMRERTAGSR